MATIQENFEKTFESQKPIFKKLLGKNWDEDKSLYLQYLQTMYTATSCEISNIGFSKIK